MCKKFILFLLSFSFIILLCSCSETTERSSSKNITEIEYQKIHNKNNLTETGYTNSWLDLSFTPAENMYVRDPETIERENQSAIAKNLDSYCITAMEYASSNDPACFVSIRILKLTEPDAELATLANKERDALTEARSTDDSILHTVWKDDYTKLFLLENYLTFSRIDYYADGTATENWDMYRSKEDYLIIISFGGTCGEFRDDDFLRLFTTADGTYTYSAASENYTLGSYDSSMHRYTSDWMGFSHYLSGVVNIAPSRAESEYLKENYGQYRITELMLKDSQWGNIPIKIDVLKIKNSTRSKQEIISEEQKTQYAIFAADPTCTQSWSKPYKILLVGEVYTAYHVTVNVTYNGTVLYGEECWFLYRVIGEHLVIIQMSECDLDAKLKECFDIPFAVENLQSDKFIAQKTDASIISISQQ